MHRRGSRYGAGPLGSRHEYFKSVEKALIMALYFAVVATGAVAVGAQVFGE
jgi:hypothetical protein